MTVPIATITGRDHRPGGRVRRDRLEVLAALLNAPGVDPLVLQDVIVFPANHPAYGWACHVARCTGSARGSHLCIGHERQFAAAKLRGIARADFVRNAEPILARNGLSFDTCCICPGQRAVSGWKLCRRHTDRWRRVARMTPAADINMWMAEQRPLPGFGPCRVPVCSAEAGNPVGLCQTHNHRYWKDGKPGGPSYTRRVHLTPRSYDSPVPVVFADEAAFLRWCAAQSVPYRVGVVNFKGVPPLAAAEIRWGLHHHAQLRNRTRWDYAALQLLVMLCRTQRTTSLFDLPRNDVDRPVLAGHDDSRIRMIVGEIVEALSCIYYTPADTREAGFIETDHFGRRFNHARSRFDLTAVSQRWLRDLLWDHIADVLQSPRCPRTRGPIDGLRRAAVELSAFLTVDAPDGGREPALLAREHTQRFVADQRHRARHRMNSLGVTRSDGQVSVVTDTTRSAVLNHIRMIAHTALESGRADAIGLHRDFITAFPFGETTPSPSRAPFSDDVARALADPDNLLRLSALDPNDRGLRDVWETIVFTGRRCNEVLTLRLDCIGTYRGLPMLWHDQTKVGNYNEAIRIPETLHALLEERRAKTLRVFEERTGRQPTAAERANMAMFPSNVRNEEADRSISYGFFNHSFHTWVNELDLGRAVAHQARHTLATNLLRAGATLAHIRRYLGQVSDRMAEHYTKVAHSDLEDVLNAVWVAGPGAPEPGRLLSHTTNPMSREEAASLALDLSRHSTPTEGGFCTFQPVVNGGACPWNLDCENCDKFVLSGADLLYWRRKQEQWRSIAERAPDDATADYLHDVFAPTARAIDGLEQALGALGLLEEALALDLRRPQDYFHRIWSTNFPATQLVAGSGPDSLATDTTRAATA